MGEKLYSTTTERYDAVLKAIETVRIDSLLDDLHRALIGLLRGLGDEEWQRPTTAGSWRVRDVVAHLLDGDIRRLSLARDGHRLPVSGPLQTYEEVLGFLNELNHVWVRAAERISPDMLVDLLAHVGPKTVAFLQSLDPLAPAPFAVAWTGQSNSPNWLDVGREYTERWHHQDQIREAVGAPPLASERWLRPVLDISLLALPHAFRDAGGEVDDVVELQTTGTVQERWSLVREASGWDLWSGGVANPRCRITADSAATARLLLHRTPAEHIHEKVTVEGDEHFVGPFLRARAVMV